MFDESCFLYVDGLKVQAWLTQGVAGGVLGPSPPPVARFAHGLSAVDNRLFVFGGSGDLGSRNYFLRLGRRGFTGNQ